MLAHIALKEKCRQLMCHAVGSSTRRVIHLSCTCGWLETADRKFACTWAKQESCGSSPFQPVHVQKYLRLVGNKPTFARHGLEENSLMEAALVSGRCACRDTVAKA